MQTSYKERGVAYVLDILPHLRVGDSSPSDNFQKIMERWELDYKPLLVGDSAFGSIPLAEQINDWGGSCLLALGANVNPEQLQLLNYHLPSQAGRIIRKDNLVISLGSIPNDSGDLVSKRVVCTKLNFRDIDLESIERQSDSSIPQIERGELMNMTHVEISNFCAQHNLRVKNGTKETRVNLILRKIEILSSERSVTNSIASYFDSKFTRNLPLPNKKYGELFNMVDTFDKKLNKTREAHKNSHWRSKFILIILRIAVTNFYVRATCKEKVDLFNFRKRMARNLKETA